MTRYVRERIEIDFEFATYHRKGGSFSTSANVSAAECMAEDLEALLGAVQGLRSDDWSSVKVYLHPTGAVIEAERAEL
jgi:hypothetical protein